MVLIKEVDTSDPDLIALIATHKQYCVDQTPQGSGHAVAPTKENLSHIRYWLAYREDDAVGCIGLKQIEDGHAEIKTMHVRSTERGGGIGASLVENVQVIAKENGMRQLSLETGCGDGFAASRRLYERSGFRPCPPFGDYANDPFSYCMTLSL